MWYCCKAQDIRYSMEWFKNNFGLKGDNMRGGLGVGIENY